MDNQIQEGRVYFIIENGHLVRKVKALKLDGEFVTLRCENGCGWTRLRKSRLYLTKEAAQASIPRPKKKIVLSHWI